MASETRDQTHNPECWRDPRHHSCAVAEIRRLREAIRDTHRAIRFYTDRMDWRTARKIRALLPQAGDEP